MSEAAGVDSNGGALRAVKGAFEVVIKLTQPSPWTPPLLGPPSESLARRIVCRRYHHRFNPGCGRNPHEAFADQRFGRDVSRCGCLRIFAECGENSDIPPARRPGLNKVRSKKAKCRSEDAFYSSIAVVAFRGKWPQT